jgi:hypothetical protein
MKKLFLFVFLLLPLCLSARQIELAICAIFRDDAKWLPEWIEFHEKQGVQHFYLYNNLSSDNPKQILKKYIKSGLVDFIEWPFESTGKDFFTIQCNAYMDCVNKHRMDCAWIAFIDTDEFLFCPDKTNLCKFLKKQEKHASVSAYWMMYGTSHINIPPGGKMLDYLVYRAKDDFVCHQSMKTIAQPKYIESIPIPHIAYLKKGKANKQFEVDELRINHYWSRDLDFFYNIKLPRRVKWYPNIDDQLAMECLMNDVYDPILSNSSR